MGVFYPCGAITPGTVFAHARRPEVRRRLIASLRSIQLDELDGWRVEMLQAGVRRCGDAWDYLDNICVSHAFADLARPRHVLEIGVRRGMCTAAVVSAAPDANLHCVDLWIAEYGGHDNPGPDAVRPNLGALGHRGSAEFYTGDSHSVLPGLFRQNPDLLYDLILVDGDHSESGALQDLSDVFPRLAPGGMLVFDDIAHPSHLVLLRVWRHCMASLGMKVRSAEYLDHGHGVAIAIRATGERPRPA